MGQEESIDDRISQIRNADYSVPKVEKPQKKPYYLRNYGKTPVKSAKPTPFNPLASDDIS